MEANDLIAADQSTTCWHTWSLRYALRWLGVRAVVPNRTMQKRLGREMGFFTGVAPGRSAIAKAEGTSAE